MIPSLNVRSITRQDYSGWRPLWDGYNEFYGRSGLTALSEQITSATWERFFNASEPVYALVAEENGNILGIAHYLFHRSTTRLQDVCYLQDLFTLASCRRRGVGRLLIQEVYAAAMAVESSRVYWTTYETNKAGRALYEKVARHSGVIVYSQEL